MHTGFHRAALESILAKVLYLLSRLAIPPMVLTQVGLPEYGLWSIAFVLVGYLGLSVSGLATVYVREIARAYERQDALYASGMLSTGVALALFLGGGFCLGLSLCTPWILKSFAVSPALYQLATLLIGVTTLVFLADLTLGAWGYVLHGLNRVNEQQRIWVASFMLEWVIIASMLYLGLGMTALLGGFLLRYIFSICCAWWRVKSIWPELKMHPRHINQLYLKPFLHFGLKSQLSDGLAMILHSADRILAGISFGSASTAILDLGSKLPATAISISSGISLVVLPRSACMNEAQLAEFYPKALRLSVFSLLFIMPLLVACAPAISLAWLGLRPESHLIVQTLLWVTPAWHLHTLTGCASSALRGQGQLRLEFVYHGLRAIALGLVFYLSTSLAHFIALFAIGSACSALCYLFLASHRLSMSSGQIFKQALFPLGLCYSAAYSLVLLWPWHLINNRHMALLELLQMSSLFTLLLAGLSWLIILKPHEKTWLSNLAAKLFKHEVSHA
ncbi:oligosaccharide flippase family protein [Chitinibacter bivalviorum]|uniref:Oligosaccharide flippase family protein n=1 Tax=Chitinibacter bivalviorum TaxID=2739434 RepID=A0A7H9BGC2_9NEIS|nr:oligosaccharide flippase family protein [Chitinibacter bivalviorum]QLG87773.1 oligosaccharide flippase family protein [Chitinibacter bivalviorum]